MHREYNGRLHGLQYSNFSESKLTSFNIALITAGELRSFPFVEKSWDRYFLKKYKANIKIFGHIIAPQPLPPSGSSSASGSTSSSHHHQCPLTTFGLQRFHKIATEYEISSPVSYIPSRDILNRLPLPLKQSSNYPKWKKRLGEISRGNYVDMFVRRKRAYELALHYSEIHQLKWDLIFFLRLDTAFYDPSLDLYSIYQTILKFEQENSIPIIPSKPSPDQGPEQLSNQGPEQNTQILSHGIFIPGSCNFGGVCDRFAIGTPEAMDLYFQTDWYFKVLDWAYAKITSRSSSSSTSFSSTSPEILTLSDETLLRDYLPRGKYENFNPTLPFITEMRNEIILQQPTSETMLSLWFVLNNITQLNYDRDLAFATLRVEHANDYCNMTRIEYIYQHPNRTAFIWDPDKYPMYDVASPYLRFDHTASPELRCGAHTQHLDVKKICERVGACNCNRSFGHLYKGVERRRSR
jgi:hypothetical protein